MIPNSHAIHPAVDIIAEARPFRRIHTEGDVGLGTKRTVYTRQHVPVPNHGTELGENLLGMKWQEHTKKKEQPGEWGTDVQLGA